MQSREPKHQTRNTPAVSERSESKGNTRVAEALTWPGKTRAKIALSSVMPIPYHSRPIQPRDIARGRFMTSPGRHFHLALLTVPLAAPLLVGCCLWRQQNPVSEQVVLSR